MSQIEQEFEEFDREQNWHLIYQVYTKRDVQTLLYLKPDFL